MGNLSEEYFERKYGKKLQYPMDKNQCLMCGKNCYKTICYVCRKKENKR